MNLITIGMICFGAITVVVSFIWAYSMGVVRRQCISACVILGLGIMVWNATPLLSWAGYNPQGALIQNAVIMLLVTRGIVPFLVLPVLMLMIPAFSRAGRVEVSQEFHAFEKELGFK